MTRKDTNSLALGFFDGLHQGHMQILHRAISGCGDGTCYATTFEDAIVDFTHKQPKLLTTLPTRKAQLAAVGAIPYVLPATAEFFSQTKREFLDGIVKVCQPSLIVCGEDFRFGCDREGDALYLKHYGEEHGISVEIVPLARGLDGSVISTTYIKQLLMDCNFAAADELLQFPYAVDGLVVHGTNTGARIGFPTANVVPDKRFFLPPNGVYVTKSRILDCEFTSITNIGGRPTFGDAAVKLETHFINDMQPKNYYGEQLTIKFLTKIRDIVSFNSALALQEQLRKDKAFALSYTGDKR